jgi:hypothetical protein
VGVGGVIFVDRSEGEDMMIVVPRER